MAVFWGRELQGGVFAVGIIFLAVLVVLAYLAIRWFKKRRTQKFLSEKQLKRAEIETPQQRAASLGSTWPDQVRATRMGEAAPCA